MGASRRRLLFCLGLGLLGVPSSSCRSGERASMDPPEPFGLRLPEQGDRPGVDVAIASSFALDPAEAATPLAQILTDALVRCEASATTRGAFRPPAVVRVTVEDGYVRAASSPEREGRAVTECLTAALAKARTLPLEGKGEITMTIGEAERR